LYSSGTKRADVPARSSSPAALAFEAALAADRRAGPLDAKTAAAIDEVVHKGSSAWPELSLGQTAFAAYVAAHLPKGGALGELLESLHAGDLYLAAACATQNADALRSFERRFLSSPAYLPAQARRAGASEILQRLREHLFTNAPGEAPRIGQYTGRAPLGAWLRMVATRLTLDQHRSESASAQRERDFADSAAPQDPELQLLNATYRVQLQQTLQAALKELSPRDASLLRSHFIEGQTAEAIGRVYGVAGRTVRRWLADIREQVVEQLRARLKQDYGIGGSQLASLERFARSQLDMSLSDLMR
jgi:RNA polymerase sigma-70 factor (ECF subfamily)